VRRGLAWLVIVGAGCGPRQGALDLSAAPEPAPAQWSSEVPADVRVWHATALRAALLGDTVEAGRALDWMWRLAPTSGPTALAGAQIAVEAGLLDRAERWLGALADVDRPEVWVLRARVATARRAPDAAQRWLAAARAAPEWWPEAWEAHRDGPDAAAAAAGWGAAEVPAHQRAARARALASVGDWAAANSDLREAMAWSPSPALLELWVWVGLNGCELGEPWRWAVERGVVGWEAPWREAAASLAKFTGDPLWADELGVSVSHASCGATEDPESVWSARPGDPRLLRQLAAARRTQGEEGEAQRLEQWAAEREAAEREAAEREAAEREAAEREAAEREAPAAP
jgi:hypothetical protein